jgi:hypothetical protein
MDPNSRLVVNQTRIAELHAEAAANRLAAQPRPKSVVDAPCREGATSRALLSFVIRSWIESLRGQIRRAAPARRG